MGLAAEGRDLPYIQQYLLVRIIVLHLDQGTCSLHGNAQFFLQLPGQCRLHGFPGLDLAPGKLPKAPLMLSIGTSGDQDLAIGIPDDGRCHMHSFHRVFLWSVIRPAWVPSR